MTSTAMVQYPINRKLTVPDDKRINCPKHKISFLDPPTKRRRFLRIDKNASCRKPKNDINSSTAFKKASKRVRDEISTAKLKWPEKFLKKSEGDKTKRVYTANDVDEILGTVTAEVYEEIERRLSFEFEMVLRQKLDEQLRQFRQFSKDNFAKAYGEHSLKYIS
ncbi:hypothetical protein MHBO_000481 [Bonamia ostreae]|uniref:Uncharacterized protein n=1 Tax=Bonamia ostreae TaxID=126728 RepID=A0ABV2AGK5_9EUKA